ncbi:MAG: polynucleotide adenylyltransferase [Acidobacteria bacterium]|nr:MAG: polynucleotide adenylyltransferase [Acidobacteriota bacterium]
MAGRYTLSVHPPQLPGKSAAPVLQLARQARDRGGRAFLVGGFVRDLLSGRPSKDVDVEVFGLALSELEVLLSGLGSVLRVGRAFGVLRVKGLDVDFSIPRRDSKVGKGHRGFATDYDTDMTPEQAVRRRDLTINALLMDPLTGELVDPCGGQEDLAQRRLRAVDPRTFPEDPLRPLRVAQLAARLEFQPDEELIGICRGMDLSELPVERIWDEWHKLLLRGRRPSLGLEFLLAADLLRFTPPLQDLVGVPQDPEWHPEGDVWVHTLAAVDAAAGLRTGEGELDQQIMLGALCHDLGKASTTRFFDGRWRSHNHDTGGEKPAEALLAALGAPGRLSAPVKALVRCHLRPAWFVAGGAQASAYRRLARQLDAAGTRMSTLERVARSDALGTATPDGLAGRFPAGDAFLARAADIKVKESRPTDVVQGRHLIARGLQPGPFFSPILEQCRVVQDENGWDDPERILDRALADLVDPGSC